MPSCAVLLRRAHPCPTRRSSDLAVRAARPEARVVVDAGETAGLVPVDAAGWDADAVVIGGGPVGAPPWTGALLVRPGARIHPLIGDRKSTRLNSSHLVTSYAVVRRPTPSCTPVPYTTLFRSGRPRRAPGGPGGGRRRRDGRARAGGRSGVGRRRRRDRRGPGGRAAVDRRPAGAPRRADPPPDRRSEEHTSELQSPCNLVCRRAPSYSVVHTRALHDALPIWPSAPRARRPGWWSTPARRPGSCRWTQRGGTPTPS